MTSVGGDAFWLIYDAAANAVRYIDGGGRATSRGTIEAFTRRGLAESALPGSVARHAHRARRRRELGHGARRLRPAAAQALPGKRDRLCARRLSGDGAARALARCGRGELAKSAEAAAIFLRAGRRPSGPNNPDLARTLEAIASDGWYGFYDGEVARELVRYSDANDGFFTADDLKAQSARWGEPIKGSYRDVTIYETPAADPGLRRAQDAEPAGTLELHKSRSSGPTRCI